VRTASGATAVQLVAKRRGRRWILEHFGSAHDEVELAVLVAAARDRLEQIEPTLDLGIEVPARAARMVPRPVTDQLGVAVPGRQNAELVPSPRVVGASSDLLFEVLAGVYQRLGFDVVGDAVFRDLVLTRVVEPTSLLDTGRVLTDLGVKPASYATMKRTLTRAAKAGYRDKIATACYEHASTAGDLSLVLYDVTTLYFEAEYEDDLRKVGYSKERRVDPQVVVGLLVDRGGFPLQIGCFEGNKAETATILPVVKAFQARHGIEGMVVVADAGMLSANNLRELDEAGLRFIVGSRVTKAPNDLASHFRWHGDAFTDGQTIDTLTPKRAGRSGENDPMVKAEPTWEAGEHPGSWRAVWAYSAKRAARDAKTLTLQENRAKAVVAGEKAARTPRFVKTSNGARTLDEASLTRARSLVGLKGYVSNIPVELMPAAEVIASYHSLWQVEASFRMSKTDLRARPMFHHTREAIEAHLTIVFTALALAREVQARTGLSIRNVIRQLRPLRSATILANGQTHKIPTHIPHEQQALIDALR